jgi:hypothetical protein
VAFLLLLLYPALTFVRFLKFLVSLLVFEDVRGKVILITGASSGMGEVCSIIPHQLTFDKILFMNPRLRGSAGHLSIESLEW